MPPKKRQPRGTKARLVGRISLSILLVKKLQTGANYAPHCSISYLRVLRVSDKEIVVMAQINHNVKRVSFIERGNTCVYNALMDPVRGSSR